MCGLLGEFGKTITPKNQFIDLLKYSRQRGPDMTGYYNNQKNKAEQIPSVQFGFNRLAILDLRKSANQPIISKSEKFVVNLSTSIALEKLELSILIFVISIILAALLVIPVKEEYRRPKFHNY